VRQVRLWSAAHSAQLDLVQRGGGRRGCGSLIAANQWLVNSPVAHSFSCWCGGGLDRAGRSAVKRQPFACEHLLHRALGVLIEVWLRSGGDRPGRARRSSTGTASGDADPEARKFNRIRRCWSALCVACGGNCIRRRNGRRQRRRHLQQAPLAGLGCACCVPPSLLLLSCISQTHMLTLTLSLTHAHALVGFYFPLARRCRAGPRDAVG
jgi:hypothetical protein